MLGEHNCTLICDSNNAMWQVANGGQQQHLWQLEHDVKVSCAPCAKLTCVEPGRHPAFGFKMDVLDQFGIIDFSSFRQECFSYLVGARLLDHFPW